MTQHCPYDEKLLDYLYEEMSAEEAKAFSDHVAGCAECQAAMEKLGAVRTAWRALPPPAIDEDTLQRMTAQILQQSLQQAQPTAPQKAAKPAVQTLGSTKDLPSAEVGKLLPFRRKGIKAVLFHPATGIVAAAAMALVFVVVKGWQNEPILPTIVEKAPPPGAIRPAPAAAPVATGQPEAAKEQAGDEETIADQQNKFGKLGSKGESGPAPKVALAPPMDVAQEKVAGKKLRGVVARDSLDDALGHAPPAAPATGGLRGKGDSGGFSDSFSQLGRGGGRAAAADKALEPTAPPEPAQEREQARGAVAGAKEERRPMEAPAKMPPPPPQAQAQAPAAAAPSPSYEPTAPPPQAAAEIAEGKGLQQQQVNEQQRKDLSNATANRRSRALSAESQAGPEGGAAALLGQLREHVKKGQCREAADAELQLKQRFPGFEIPADDHAAVARTCPARQNQNQYQFDNDEGVAESVAKPRAPAATSMPDYKRAKKSAPAKAKAKAAPAY